MFKKILLRVELIAYSDAEKKIVDKSEFTENEIKNSSDNTIKFPNIFKVSYLFERHQLLDLKIYNNDKDDSNYELISTSVGEIMGSKDQCLKRVLKDGEVIYIIGNEIDYNSEKLSLDIKCLDLIGVNVRYSLFYLGSIKNLCNTRLYDSEIILKKNNNNVISFETCKIPMAVFGQKEDIIKSEILIQLIDFNHNQILCQYRGRIKKLITSQDLQLKMNNSAKAIIKCSIKKESTFISYLKSGMNMILTIGIDFTNSNKSYKEKDSYHYLGEGMNDYEKAIRSCGDIVAYYTNDQLFPVFGFGFAFIDPVMNDFEGKYTDSNFPINCNRENPKIKTIDEVLKEYRKFLTKIHLAGPTKFSPMLKDLNYEVKKGLKEGKKMDYHIIMILTDGQIDDMEETKKALVEASFLPISVIIIGIGNENFENMDILDADQNPLYDKTNRKANRDLVQFVYFNDFKDNPKQLAEKVLEEIPRQVVEYYLHRDDAVEKMSSTNE